MRMIQSSTNPRIQKFKKLLKNRKQNLFVIEGKKLFREAVAANLRFEEIFVTPDVWSHERELLEPLEHEGTTLLLITPRLLKSISDLETPQGILGVARKPQQQENLTITRVALLLVSIRDPGNFGAIVRTAEACGCDWIAYTSDCVDPFQPKVVRASMGSIFRMPVVETKDPVSFLIERKVSSYGLTVRGDKSLLNWRPEPPFILCIGSESHGLPMDLPLRETIFIPMKGRVESLNAAVASGVCLYWTFLP